MRTRETRAKRDDRNASSLAVRLVDFTASREGGLIYHRRIIYHRKRQSSLSLSLSLFLSLLVSLVTSIHLRRNFRLAAYPGCVFLLRGLNSGTLARDEKQ